MQREPRAVCVGGRLSQTKGEQSLDKVRGEPAEVEEPRAGFFARNNLARWVRALFGK